MSGPLVQFVGGPLDGQETHAVTYTDGEVRLFEAFGSHVHVYRRPHSPGGWKPFRYDGIRLRDHGDVVLPLPT